MDITQLVKEGYKIYTKTVILNGKAKLIRIPELQIGDTVLVIKIPTKSSYRNSNTEELL